MSEAFDPYYKWLGIPPEEQPPNHYRLLAIRPFESDPDVIEAAAEQRMTLLRSRQTGRHAALSQKLLNELAAARARLLDPQQRAAYDAELQRDKAEVPLTSAAAAPAPAPVPTTAPPAAPLDDLPKIDPLAAAPGAYGHGGEYRGAAMYGPARTPTAWPVLIALGGVGLLAIGIVVAAAAVLVNLAAPPSDSVPPAASNDHRPIEHPLPANQPGDDLLAQIDLQRDVVRGEFQLADGALIVPRLRAAQLEIDTSPPPAYRWEVIVQRLDGEDSLNLGLVCGDRQVMLVLDGFDPKVSGLNLLDRRSADRNASRTRGRVFTDERPRSIVCTVRPGSIHATVDGRPVVDWQGDTSRLSLDQRFWKVRTAGRLTIGAWDTSYKISRMRLTPLSP